MFRNALLLLLACWSSVAFAQDAPKPPTEDDIYPMITLPLPEGLVLEVGGLEWLDAARTRLAVATRRGEVWLLDNPYASKPVLASADKSESGPADESNVVEWKRMLFGLHEPLGMLRLDDGLYVAQRAEVSRLVDDNADDRIDLIETICDKWEISGSYHEYAFGPKLDKDGKLWVTLNRAFGGEKEGKAFWRGWAVKVDRKTGEMIPVCFGLRSPAGLGANADGEFFYTDNQGDWVPTCKLSHMKQGSFQGNPLALHTIDHPDSPFKDYPKETPVSGLKLKEARDAIPRLTLPAVWFPYPRMGKSTSDILLDDTKGKFGPFSGQLFVGDQSTSIVTRVYLEKVNGEYQGVCFPFREGFQCGVLRQAWGNDGSMFVGQTNRGWGSSGGKPWGLQRLTWSGVTPFEVHEMHAKPDGFELTFTMPVDPKTAADPKSYSMSTWTYYHHSGYGCKPIDTHDLKITAAKVADDGKSVHLTIEGLQEGYVCALRSSGVRSSKQLPLLHDEAFYTLNAIPAAK